MYSTYKVCVRYYSCHKNHAESQQDSRSVGGVSNTGPPEYGSVGWVMALLMW
jgi:hypothetical protein